jgi:hypothetical protein
MRIGYTLWRDLPGLSLRRLALELDGLVDFYVVTFAFYTDGTRLKFAGLPFCKPRRLLSDIPKLIREADIGYWVKLQLHPMPKSLPPGAIPEWWPGYVDFPLPAATYMIGGLARGISKVMSRLIGYDPETVVAGVELARLVNVMDWTKVKDLVNRGVKAKVIYGANFWQPLRTKYDRTISWLYTCGLGSWAVKRIMKGTPYERADGKLLADIAYHAKLHRDRMSGLNGIGLSAYFYPSMKKGVSPEKAMRDFRWRWFKLDYAQTALEWAEELNKELIISETGVIYNSPIAKDRADVVRWFLDSFKVWNEASVSSLVIWDEVRSKWVIEALRRWKDEKAG